MDCYEKLIERISEATPEELKQIAEKLESFIEEIEERADLLRSEL